MPDVDIDDDRERDSKEPIGKRVSWSQLAHKCGLQLEQHRARVPEGPRSIALIYGSALHYGIETWLADNTRPIGVAVEAALAYLHDAVVRADLDIDDDPGIAWDDAPRMTEGKPAEPPRPFKGEEGKANPRMTKGKEAVAPEPYASDLANIETVEDAEPMLVASLRNWCWSIGKRLNVKATETEYRLAFTKLAPGWEWSGFLDIEHELDGHRIIDIKSANRAWSAEKIASKRPQAWLYMAAVRITTGIAPAGFEFHVLPKGDGTVQVIDIPYDPAAINRYLKYVVAPTIKGIEAGVYVANLEGPFPHSEKFCSYWHVCPLGAAANPKEGTA